MSNLFSLDSPFMNFLDQMCDLILLNIVYVITCIPIVTIGAATSALYDVCFRINTEREQGMFRSYFKAFRRDFKQATIVWVIFAFLLVDLTIALFITISGSKISKLFFIETVISLTVVIMALGYVFPLISRFDTKLIQLLKNSILLAMAYLPRTLLITVLNVLPIAMLLIRPTLFWAGSIFLFIIYFAGVAYINAQLLKKVINRLIPVNTDSSSQAVSN